MGSGPGPDPVHVQVLPSHIHWRGALYLSVQQGSTAANTETNPMY